MTLTAAQGTVLVLGPSGSGKSTLINTFLYNMTIRTQHTRHPRVYRYRWPAFSLGIVENVSVETLQDVSSVLIVPPAGLEAASYVVAAVEEVRRLATDLITLLIICSKPAVEQLQSVTSTLRVPLCAVDFRLRKEVLPCFAQAVEHSQKDHTWDRRKGVLLARSRLHRLRLI